MSNPNHQASHSIDLLGGVNNAIAEATCLASGYNIEDMKHCHVQMSSNYRNSGDMKTNVAAALYLMHVAKANRNRKQEKRCTTNGDSENEDSCNTVMEVVTTTPLGFQMPRRYDNVKSLAESIISLVPEDAMQTLIAHAFIQEGPKKSLHIVITTRAHLNWQLRMDKLHCVTCGNFFKGSRGLRTHEIIDHKFATEEARQDALDSELQIIVYVPQHTEISASAQCKLSSDIDIEDKGLSLVRKGDLGALRKLMVLDHWNPHTALDKHGHTCLTWAAGEGHLDMCRFFVNECGMNPLAMTGARKRQRQALHWAARNGRISVCNWLINECGADVDAGTDDGSTPLHLAIWNNQPATIKWLLEESNSDINRKNSHGCNASQWAALSGNLDIIIYLKKQGLNLSIINSNGRSALHKAGLKGHLSVCKWLLTPQESGGAGLGANHVRPDIEGDTPASLAKSNGHAEVEKWLIVMQEYLNNEESSPL